jgi:hypothetical protein
MNGDDASMPTDIESDATAELKRAPNISCNDAVTPKDSLPTCNEKPWFRMRLCIARSSHFYRAKFIPQLFVNGPTIVATDSGNDAESVLNGNGK